MNKEQVENITEQVKQTQRLIDNAVKAERERILKLMQTHTEHEGGYCDTGGDMGWACRSECMELAVKRIKAITNQDDE